jgi:hypothetical protein
MNISPKLITIEWEGPFKLEEIIANYNEGKDYGLYQIYGTHNIFGPNSLLYLGKAEDQTFSIRIPAHKEWIEWESAPAEIYLGRLGGIEPMTKDRYAEWSSEIYMAERLLIYFSSPPYNSHNIQSYGDVSNVIVINYKKRNRLPIEVSTYYEDAIKDSRWKVYE